ncbi:hypothetical protein QFC20_004594 [Naganishia adeliensis]|uniref:Uncharacterized protein n=1 Tax=Naganishia adeliensis TaxID=92952 RepID=A0ACC2VZ68_9TREE|nr:hypothetical protein QFC20_004594 [Naganishia adeliensis]
MADTTCTDEPALQSGSLSELDPAFVDIVSHHEGRVSQGWPLGGNQDVPHAERSLQNARSVFGVTQRLEGRRVSGPTAVDPGGSSEATSSRPWIPPGHYRRKQRGRCRRFTSGPERTDLQAKVNEHSVPWPSEEVQTVSV